MTRVAVFVTAWLLTGFASSLVGAQASPPVAEPQPINSLIAMMINTGGTLLLVQLLKSYVVPQVRTATPWLLPILAMLGGPVVSLVQSYLAKKLGYPVDLSPMVGLFSGAAAVAVNQTVKNVDPDPTSRLRKLIG